MNLSRRTFLEAASAAALSGTLGARAVQKPDEYGVVELRQYTLRGGQRDTLIAMFETSFLEPQNAIGAHVIGTFRDLDDADRFVWIRGFHDMAARERALTAFYGGPLWQAKRAAANATMLDSDNVLLLRPIAPERAFSETPGADSPAGSIVGAMIYYLGSVDSLQFADFFDQTLAGQLGIAGASPIARLVSEESPNNFPKLPVREHERTFVCFAKWPSRAAEEAFFARLGAQSGWRDAAPGAVLPGLMRKPERLRLAPTRLSEVR